MPECLAYRAVRDGNVGSVRFALPGSDIHTDLALVCTADGLRFDGWLATNQTYDVSVTTRWGRPDWTIWGHIGTVKVAEP